MQNESSYAASVVTPPRPRSFGPIFLLCATLFSFHSMLIYYFYSFHMYRGLVILRTGKGMSDVRSKVMSSYISTFLLNTGWTSSELLSLACAPFHKEISSQKIIRFTYVHILHGFAGIIYSFILLRKLFPSYKKVVFNFPVLYWPNSSLPVFGYIAFVSVNYFCLD